MYSGDSHPLVHGRLRRQEPVHVDLHDIHSGRKHIHRVSDGGLHNMFIRLQSVCVLNLYCSAYISGAGMNPSRSFGPALVFNYWGQLWIYTFGPLIGACIAVVIYRFMTHHRKLRMPYLTFRDEEGWDDD